VLLYLKKLEKIISVLVLTAGLLTPMLIFLNRFLIPDVSFDSLNYHLYLGFKGFNWSNNGFEFFPTGIHNFSPLIDMPGYVFFKLLGYRLGSIFSLLAIYLAIWGIYKLIKLIYPKIKILGSIVLSFLFVSSFLSFELFLGIASYYNDGLSACLAVWSVYFLIKYFKHNRIKDLLWSMVLLSILLFGKQTNMYLVVGMFMYLTLVIIWKKEKSIKKIKTILISGVVAGFLPFWWYLKNFLMTGNPVFPFYNAIFRSKYFAPISFGEAQFGGRNLWERIWWGIASIAEPTRLGQVHDLFNDYKINLYFLTAIALLLVLIYKKKFKSIEARMIIMFLIVFECWSMLFGYLRYALVLEFWNFLGV
jgi:hypothetical protein